MNRRTMLKSAAVVAAAIATPAAAVECNSIWGASPIRLAYDAYRRAYNNLYGPDAGEEISEWLYSPQQVEYDIACLTFWNCPCYSVEDVAEKVRLIEETQDLKFDLERGSALDAISGQKASQLFLQSLKGKTSDNINADFLDDIRVSYAEWHSEEAEEKNAREERRIQEEAAAVAERTATRAKEEVERNARYARMSPEQRSFEDQMRQALDQWMRAHDQEKAWKAANPELAV